VRANNVDLFTDTEEALPLVIAGNVVHIGKSNAGK
jgi:hypothetical protein